MRNKLFLMMVLLGVTHVYAEEYTYLTFELTDGTKASVASSSLTLTFSGNTLNAGEQTFELSNLSKMYFSASDETTTGISAVSAETLSEATEVYDLSGHRVSKGEMRKGIYVVKTNTGTHKMIVR